MAHSNPSPSHVRHSNLFALRCAHFHLAAPAVHQSAVVQCAANHKNGRITAKNSTQRSLVANRKIAQNRSQGNRVAVEGSQPIKTTAVARRRSLTTATAMQNIAGLLPTQSQFPCCSAHAPADPLKIIGLIVHTFVAHSIPLPHHLCSYRIALAVQERICVKKWLESSAPVQGNAH